MTVGAISRDAENAGVVVERQELHVVDFAHLVRTNGAVIVNIKNEHGRTTIRELRERELSYFFSSCTLQRKTRSRISSSDHTHYCL